MRIVRDLTAALAALAAYAFTVAGERCHHYASRTRDVS